MSGEDRVAGSEVEFRVMDPARPPASELIEEMVVEVSQFYGRVDGAASPSATPADFSPPGGTFLVGWVDGTAVAGGGIKRLDPETAEIKRMYLRPAWRGKGLGRRLLGALEAEALRLGYRRCRLDTGRYQHTAIGLYERSGYVPIADYNANPFASYWGEKDLEG